MTLNIDAIMHRGEELDFEVSSIGNLIERSLLMATSITFVATHKRLVPCLVALALIILVTFTCATQTSYNSFSWSRYLHSLFTMIFFLLFLTASPTRKDQLWVMKVVAITPIVSVIIGAFYAAAGIHPSSMVDVIGVARLQGSYSTPAWLGALASSAVFCSIRLADLISLRYFFLAFINAVILLMTAARTPIAVAVIISLASLFLGFKKQIRFKLGAAIAGIAIVAPAIAIFGQSVVQRFLESGANGRDILWSSVGPLMRDFSDFGIGLGHQPLALSPDVIQEAQTAALHNEYLRLALELGTNGCILIYLLLLFMLLYECIHEKLEMPGTFLLAIAGFALYCYSDNAFSVPSILLYLPISMMATKAKKIKPRVDVSTYSRQPASKSKPAREARPAEPYPKAIVSIAH